MSDTGTESLKTSLNEGPPHTGEANSVISSPLNAKDSEGLNKAFADFDWTPPEKPEPVETPQVEPVSEKPISEPEPEKTPVEVVSPQIKKKSKRPETKAPEFEDIEVSPKTDDGSTLCFFWV
jgi:hypothetical protein